MALPVVAAWRRYLIFAADTAEIQQISWRRFLGPGLAATWLAGVGRYWDHPSAHLLQTLGVGSVIYVTVLAAVLWIIVAPLRPVGWTYLQVLTLVTLTSPPAWLYAIPVERWVSMGDAIQINMWFLAVVAAWRVALLLFTLKRYARLSWGRAIVTTVLPLTLIVASLTVLNLEKAVFEIMGGLRSPTPHDGAYMVVVTLTLLSVYTAIPLVFAYIAILYDARREAQAPFTLREDADVQ